jgi:hypothetical protein
LRCPLHDEAKCPDYADIIDLAIMFHRDPREIWEEWDELWIERINIILEGRRLAAVDTSKKKESD